MAMEAQVEHDAASQLGPLQFLFGTWHGSGIDTFPGAPETHYNETIVFTPMPVVSNQAQAVYAVQYVDMITNAATHAPMHQETGYWMWMPAQNAVVRAPSIPRDIVIMAGGSATYEQGTYVLQVAATQGDPIYGILDSPYLNQSAPTVRFSSKYRIGPGTLNYEEVSTLRIGGQDLPHTGSAGLLRQSQHDDVIGRYIKG